MQAYEVSQKILSIGATYEVRQPGNDGILNTIQGKVLSATPKLTMREGKEGGEVAKIQGNFFKTKFQISDSQGNSVGTLSFPFIALKKSFTLDIGGKQYKATGGLTGRAFTCTDSTGKTVFEVSKQLALKDKFAVHVSESVPRDTAFLAAVAIDQKFFQDK
jgi:uncharacterized protein YxjI